MKEEVFEKMMRVTEERKALEEKADCLKSIHKAVNFDELTNILNTSGYRYPELFPLIKTLNDLIQVIKIRGSEIDDEILKLKEELRPFEREMAELKKPPTGGIQ